MSYVNWQVSFIAIDNPRSQCQPCVDLRVSVTVCVHVCPRRIGWRWAGSFCIGASRYVGEYPVCLITVQGMHMLALDTLRLSPMRDGLGIVLRGV